MPRRPPAVNIIVLLEKIMQYDERRIVHVRIVSVNGFVFETKYFLSFVLDILFTNCVYCLSASSMWVLHGLIREDQATDRWHV